MTGAAPEPFDAADLTLVHVLAGHGRAEVHELAAVLGVEPRGVRGRMRRLERDGLISGIHARHTAGSGGGLLVLLRFPGERCPTPAQLCEVAGVRRVHALCAGWDFMIEFADVDDGVPGVGGALRGTAQVLGFPAEFEVLAVHEERWCPRSESRSAGVSHPRS